MYTSERRYRIFTRKTIITYLILTVTAIIFSNVYALFGHGIRSRSMSLMFLYLLLGGVLIYLLIGLFFPRLEGKSHYRLFANLYNSGLAILTTGSLLKGILDIAGTASAYIKLYYFCGWGCVAAGAFVFIWILVSGRRDSSTAV